MCTTDRERLEWQFVEAISEVMGDLGRLHMLTRNPECSLENRIKIAALCVFCLICRQCATLHMLQISVKGNILRRSYIEDCWYLSHHDVPELKNSHMWYFIFFSNTLDDKHANCVGLYSTPYLLQNLHSPASNFRIKISHSSPFIFLKVFYSNKEKLLWMLMSL